VTYPPEELIAHYRLMLVIRHFEETLSGLFGEGVITGTAHFCIGQEACAVGAVAALRPEDMVTSNHRGHGHFLAKGADPRRLMAELFGKVTGYSRGRGGSQHMADFSFGFLGSNGITAGMIPVATGAALTQRLKKTGKVVLCFFGDGACGAGAFHEAVNMGAIWDLPIVYFLENNQYAMSMPVDKAFKIKDLAQRALGYGIVGLTVDGNDYFCVREVTKEAVERARQGLGPTLIEAKTYRRCGHSKSDGCEYVPAGEVERWAERDPLHLMKEALMDQGILTEEHDEQLTSEAAQTIEEAVRFARESPDPDPATVRTGLFASLDA